MSWFSHLNGRDRQLLAITGVCTVVLIVVIAVFGPSNDEQNRMPSSYSNGSHGARAAFLLLQRSGYSVERSTDSLDRVAESTNAQTTLILADPFYNQTQEGKKAVEQILARGGRVIATGYTGALVLPNHHETALRHPALHACTATPSGLSTVASSGEVRMLAEASWEEVEPAQEVAYRCDSDAVVVMYPAGKGRVIWWASSMPLENVTIGDAGNLALLLNSVGAKDTTRIVWDESLHGASPSLWSYTAGTVLPYLWWQCGLIGLLLVLSFSRRSGPLRPDPVTSRAAPLEFTRALGSLYRKAGATNISVRVAYRGFQLALERSAGIKRDASAQEMAAQVSRLSGVTVPNLEAQIEEAGRALEDVPVTEKRALHLVQVLHLAEQQLRYPKGTELGQ
jgi:hypothetical protein